MPQYLHSALSQFEWLFELVTPFAMPTAVVLGLAVIALAIARRQDGVPLDPSPCLAAARSAARWLGAALVPLAVLAALGMAESRERGRLERLESAESTRDPQPDAPPVRQFGPSAAMLVERTYTRHLSLPPQLLERLGSEGLGALAPFLTDPSTGNVLRLRDTVRRSGSEAILTREVTRTDEEPLDLDEALVRVSFRRLGTRAYDAHFEGRYVFRNAGQLPLPARFQFPAPTEGTLRGLEGTVNGAPMLLAGDGSVLEWRGTLPPGTTAEAVLRYQAMGARAWRYDLGSRRRRVMRFRLEADGARDVRFPRGSLPPTRRGSASLAWELDNVISAQQVALSFVRDTTLRDGYLQALDIAPGAFLLLVVAGSVIVVRRGATCSPAAAAAAAGSAGLGLGAIPILAAYVGPVAAALLSPAIGVVLGSRLAARTAPAQLVPAALLPATCLAGEHTGLLALVLLCAVATAVWRALPEGRGAGFDHGGAAGFAGPPGGSGSGRLPHLSPPYPG